MNKRYRKIISNEYTRLVAEPQFANDEKKIYKEITEEVSHWAGDELELSLWTATLNYIKNYHKPDRVLEGVSIVLINAITQHRGEEFGAGL